MESATENNRRKARVKTGGKSTRLLLVIKVRGKPHGEQDKAACPMVRFELNMRVCRTREMVANSA